MLQMLADAGDTGDKIRQSNAGQSLMKQVSGPVISAETFRLCEMALAGSKVEESAPGDMETVCAKVLRPQRVC